EIGEYVHDLPTGGCAEERGRGPASVDRRIRAPQIVGVALPCKAPRGRPKRVRLPDRPRALSEQARRARDLHGRGAVDSAYRHFDAIGAVVVAGVRADEQGVDAIDEIRVDPAVVRERATPGVSR